MLDGSHRDRIGHLLVESRVGFALRHYHPGQRRWLVQVDRRIGGAANRVDINHLEILPDGAWAEVFLPGHLDGRHR